MTDAEILDGAGADAAAPTPAADAPVTTTTTDSPVVELKAEAPAAEKAAKQAENDKGELYANLTIAEDSALGADGLAAVKAFATEHKLSPEAAKALLAREEAQRGDVFNQYENVVTGWKAKLTETLGDKAPEAAGHVNAALDRFKVEGLREVLKDTGFANYPPLFEFLRQVGASISEPSRLVNGKSQQNAPNLDEAQQWANFYPNSGALPSKAAATSRMAT